MSAREFAQAVHTLGDEGGMIGEALADGGGLFPRRGEFGGDGGDLLVIGEGVARRREGEARLAGGEVRDLDRNAGAAIAVERDVEGGELAADAAARDEVHPVMGGGTGNGVDLGAEVVVAAGEKGAASVIRARSGVGHEVRGFAQAVRDGVDREDGGFDGGEGGRDLLAEFGGGERARCIAAIAERALHRFRGDRRRFLGGWRRDVAPAPQVGENAHLVLPKPLPCRFAREPAPTGA